jgi:hypothetical protein
MTLAGRKMLYAYILHDLARPTECYVGLFPEGTYATKKLPRTPALAYRPAIPQTGRWLWYGPAQAGHSSDASETCKATPRAHIYPV